MLLAIIALSLLKLSLGQYSVGPEIYHGYNHAGSVHISGHMGPVRIIPVAASAYQSHVPYHHVINHEAPVYHVETAPIAVHPVPVATYHVDDPGIVPVYEEPVIHHAEPAIHPDDVQEEVELVESPSDQREDRNFALNLDFVPFEVKMPVLSLSMRDPVKNPTVTKRKQQYLRYSDRDPRNIKFDLDIDNLDVDVETNFHSSMSANLNPLDHRMNEEIPVEHSGEIRRARQNLISEDDESQRGQDGAQSGGQEDWHRFVDRSSQSGGQEDWHRFVNRPSQPGGQEDWHRFVNRSSQPGGQQDWHRFANRWSQHGQQHGQQHAMFAGHHPGGRPGVLLGAQPGQDGSDGRPGGSQPGGGGGGKEDRSQHGRSFLV